PPLRAKNVSSDLEPFPPLFTKAGFMKNILLLAAVLGILGCGRSTGLPSPSARLAPTQRQELLTPAPRKAIKKITVERLAGNPMIYPSMMPSGIGANINGPSLIRVPSWIPNPLGKYYLYFAHHKGRYI